MTFRLFPGLACGAALLFALPACTADFVLNPPAPEIVARDATTVVASDEIVALVGDTAAADRLVAAAEAAGYELLARDTLGALDLIQLVFRRPSDTTPISAIKALEDMEPGTTAGVNHAYRSGSANDSSSVRNYAGGLIAWPPAGCTARVPVGVIDAGLDLSVLPPTDADVVQRSFVRGTSAGTHGAAVAELLVGPGRLRDAQLYHAAVVERISSGSPAASVDGILRAVDWLTSEGVSLVNVSLAGPYNKILDRGMQSATKRGLLVVAAAGNDGRAAPPRYPAAFDSTIAVTAVDAALRAYKGAPLGEHIDIAAPGVDVFVAGSDRYMSGTSLAAPFVTATIAADKSAARLSSAQAVRSWLAGSSQDLGQPGADPLFGSGLVRTGACG